ncbi:hypothetical protein SynNOUM97013_01005 [Synechococcus sp. NOUM97013]|nr:hypothetical protein SynNOUM97013_01005 [Synechococcus sp. NOUM97013]
MLIASKVTRQIAPTIPLFGSDRAVAWKGSASTFGSDRLAPPGFSFLASASRTFLFGPRLH